MIEKENLLKIFQETKRAIQRSDNLKLKELSNQTIHTASLDQDPDNIAIAVIIYSLSKIEEREAYKKYPGWKKFYNSIMLSIDGSIIALTKDNEELLKEKLKSIRAEIGKISGKLKGFIGEVFRKAQINKASRIYEHGISMETTAKLLGISIWELANYSGQTGISNVPLNNTMDVKARIKLAQDFFK